MGSSAVSGVGCNVLLVLRFPKCWTNVGGFFPPKVPAFVSVIAGKRCVKTVVVKLLSRFVAIVLVVGTIMKFSRKSDLKYKNFNSSR